VNSSQNISSDATLNVYNAVTLKKAKLDIDSNRDINDIDERVEIVSPKVECDGEP